MTRNRLILVLAAMPTLLSARYSQEWIALSGIGARVHPFLVLAVLVACIMGWRRPRSFQRKLLFWSIPPLLLLLGLALGIQSALSSSVTPGVPHAPQLAHLYAFHMRLLEACIASYLASLILLLRDRTLMAGTASEPQ